MNDVIFSIEEDHVSKVDDSVALLLLGKGCVSDSDDVVWIFAGYSISFNDFYEFRESHEEWIREFGVDPVFLAKNIMAHCQSSNDSVINSIKQLILAALWYCSINSTKLISIENLTDFIVFRIMHSFSNSTPMVISSCVSHGRSGLSYLYSIIELIHYSYNNVVLFSRCITEKAIKQSIMTAIHNVTDGEVTVREWINGGSLNSMTLDYGQFYVEHCITLFTQNYSLALAVSATIQTDFNSIDSEVTTNINDAARSYLNGNSNKKIGKHSANLISSRFNSLYNPASAFSYMVSRDGLLKIAKIAGIDINNNWALDRLKVLVDFEMIASSSSSISTHARDIIELIYDVDDGFDKSVTTQAIFSVYQDYIESSTVSYGVSKELLYRYRCTNLSSYIRLVVSCGITSLLAFTAWRRSEFGISISDIVIEKNKDQKDRLSSPVRYFVNGLVPKTNGETPLRREITHEMFRIIFIISEINLSDSSSPALYKPIKTALEENNADSSQRIYDAVSTPWPSFRYGYAPFIDMDSCADSHWFQHELLAGAYHRVCEEYERISFFFLADNHRSKKHYIWRYISNFPPLDKNIRCMLDEHLSDASKIILNKISASSEISKALVRNISLELLAGCLYPMPHAFRHMWAEGVFRRFDADIANLIRSQFKHISPSMWRRYTAFKDSTFVINKVKRNLISSLVSRYIKTNGVGYSGQIGMFLSAMISKTRIISFDDISDFCEKEFLDIMCNPWGYCILRYDQLHTAKCAESGIPSRHNACPSLCLGCINNLAGVGNIESLILLVSNHAAILSNSESDFPLSLKFNSFNTIKLAIVHLETLGAEEDLIDSYKLLLQSNSTFIY